MPETPGGKKALAAMKKTYGAEKGERVYYASRNLGKVPEQQAIRRFRENMIRRHGKTR